MNRPKTDVVNSALFADRRFSPGNSRARAGDEPAPLAAADRKRPSDR
jgi:hypothetical protein